MNVNDVIKEVVRYVASATLSKMTKIIALMLIVNAVVGMYYYLLEYTIDSGTISITFTIAVIIQIFLGTLILIDFSNSFNRAIGLYAISVAVNRISDNLSSLGSFRGIGFVYSLVMMVIAINLMYTGYSYMKGRSRSRFGMMCSSMIMLAMTLIEIYYDATAYNVPVEDLFVSYMTSWIMCGLYLILFVMVGSEKARDSLPMSRDLRVFSQVRRLDVNEPSAYITRREARELVKAFDDRSGWTDVDDGGPVEKEIRCTLYNYLAEETSMIVQKWKDLDRIYISMVEPSHGSMLNAYRISVDSITPDGSIDTCETVSMYGEHGSAYRLKVKDEVEKW